MDYPALIRELGGVLGFDLEFSDVGTCGVFFDEDEVLFEIYDTRMFIMADLGSSAGRDADCVRMLKAANLGLETGFSCIGIDEMRDQFTLSRVLEGDLEYHDFEKILSIFVCAVRWKKWLNLPPEESDPVKVPTPVAMYDMKI